ncbi:MAG: DUF3857 domain-containing protein [Gallionella sp.]|nr:DUF3857 domain-containing protein [Gallionella sp.]MDD4946056.1 DUF3857 domain-containing protein [Gallionella sp.]MDD5612237.1 DUF3857 domain-containing protein [Gallionella sp.]
MSKIISVMLLSFLSQIFPLDAAAQAPAAKPGSPGFLLEPAPAWVLAAPVDAGGKVEKAAMHSELLDEQVRVEGRSATSYNHIVRAVNETDGLSAASEIQVAFNPAYETLVFHKVEVCRKGKCANKLERSKVRLLQRESNLEQQMYDGEMTASLVLADVRVGDQVDFSYSIRGSNPVFEGKYVHTVWLASARGPARVARFRLLMPENRRVAYRVGPDVSINETLHDGLRDTRFTRLSTTQLHGDQYTPASAFLDDQLDLSEFADWQEVANWGAGLYAPFMDAPSESVKQTAQSLVPDASVPPLEKVRLALDFVQKEVRYFGTEIGENTHRPTAPERVIKQRFGDCKDKVLLLMALLKEMGVAATPVLVSTLLRNDIPAQFATPLWFNHVMLRVELDGKVYWLDGTRSAQTGPLQQRQSVGMGRGLLLDGKTTGLADLPGTDAEERIAVEETYRIAKMAEPPVLEIRTSYFGEMAEMLRAAVASQPLDTLEEKLNEAFGRFHPNLEKRAPLRVEEVAGQNAVRVVQTFNVPKFWHLSEDNNKLIGDYGLWSLVSPLRYPEGSTRQQPLQLFFPGIYRHSLVVEFDEDMTKVPASQQSHNEDAHFYLQVDTNIEPRKFQVKGELQLLKDVVLPSEWADYTEQLRRAEKNFGGAFYVAMYGEAQADKLKQQGRELIDSWQGVFARNKPVTTVQSTAMVKRLILTAALEGGRLNPEVRAQVLEARGIELDNLGLYELAQADFEEALKLKPNDGSLLAAAAANQFLSGRDAVALELARKALEVNPSSKAPHKTIAHLLYLAGDYEGAKRNLLVLLKDRSQINEGYMTLWLYLTARRNNEDAVATVQPYLARDQSVWPHPMLQYLTGAGSLEKAMEAAKGDGKDPSNLCEFYFYAGEKALIDGQANQAREYFRKSVDTGVVEYYEYDMAKRKLKSLEGK